MTLDNSWAWIVSAFVLGALLFDVRCDIRRLVRGRSVVLVGIFAWFLLEGITLSQPLRESGQLVYNFSLLCVFLSAAAFLVAYHALPENRFADSIAVHFRRLDEPELLWRLVLFCAIVGFAPVLWYSGSQFFTLIQGVLGMRKTWGGVIGRGRYGGFREAMLMLQQFVFAAGPLATILLLKSKVSLLRKIICSIVIGWGLLCAYGSGTRSSLIMAMLPVLAVVYFMSAPRIQRTMILCGLLSLPALYYLMAAMVASRNSGTLDWESGSNVQYVGSEMLQELAYIVDNVPNNCDYQMGYNYYVQVVNPIPRFLWPDKPTLDTGILMAQLKGAVDKSGEATMTNSPGLIGEMYLNFGVFGVISLSAFGGWLVRCWDGLIDRNSDSLCTMIYYLMGLSALFILGRSFNMSTLYGLVFLYSAVWLVTRYRGATSRPANDSLVQIEH